jgi:hypothetical protein
MVAFNAATDLPSTVSTVVDPSEHRVITRASIAVSPNWRRIGKLWLSAQDVGTVAIPSEYKS